MMQNLNLSGKTCPVCQTVNRPDSQFCSNCGRRFEASLRGYCTVCHSVKESDQSGLCPTCGSRLVDPQPVARPAIPAASPAPPPAMVYTPVQTPVYQPPAAKSRSSGVIIIAGILVVVFFLALLAGGYYLYQGRTAAGGLLATRAAPMAEKIKATLEQVVEATDTAAPTRTEPPPTPTEDPMASVAALPPGAACFASNRGGMSCLGPSGWQWEPWSAWFGPDLIRGMAACKDGGAFILTYRNLYQFDGQRWQEHPGPGFSLAEELICGEDGQAWAVGYDGAALFDGTGWIEHPVEEMLGANPDSEHPQGIALSPDGSVWVALDKSLAHYQNGIWTTFTDGQGWTKEYNFVDIAVDSQSQPWAASEHGLLTQQDDAWKPVLLSNSTRINTLVVDDQDRLWAGSNKNLWKYEKGKWQSYNIVRSGQSDSNVRAVALDNQGRVWIGTNWGLNVMDAKGKIVTYHMHTSELRDDEVEHVFVMGGGPPLPELAEEAPGALKGKITLNGQALVKARVEVCMVDLGIFFSGATPCTGKPGYQKTTTDENGEFRFDELPEGYYSVTVRTPDGKWKVYSGALAIGSKPVLVSSGGLRVLDELDIKQDE